MAKKRKNEGDVDPNENRKKLKKNDESREQRLEQEVARLKEQLKETKDRLNRALTTIRNPKKYPIPPHHMVLRKNEPYDYTFSEWVALFPNPIYTFQHQSISGTLNLIDCEVLKHVRSLLRLAFDIRGDGMHLLKTTFALSNVVVVRDEIKVKELFMTSERTRLRDQDLSAIRRLILDTFFKGLENDLPLAMIKLLDLLNGGPPYDELLIVHNFALMNTRARRQFVTMWYDIQMYYDNQEWQSFIDACNLLPHKTDWTTIVKGQGPLESVFNFTPYSLTDATEQPRYFRHSQEHLLDYCRMNAEHMPPEYDYDDCINLLMTTFQESISSFSKLLSDNKLLQILGPQKFFE